MGNKRVFIAVDISDEARRWAAAYIDDLTRAFPKSGIRWVPPENMHLTLRFLGDTPEERIPMIAAELSRLVRDVEPITVATGENASFGGRVLVIKIDDPDRKLADLKGRIESVCCKSGLEPETRKFDPHLTLARIKRPGAAPELAAKHKNSRIEPVESTIREIVIYESRLDPRGARYIPLHRIPLKA
ncbi:MAG TPA: RNA 2',3'-cyclic phosphodiesterase [Pyrinomonadaceae bacterium]|nr:RNA 2',3'-cyclic phosphodiesterase [Pyrinomonadaceae bacterium]HMP65750.1 RNA 2',3'-cyclic phosphodiesterase [Pyrinomonadaceae bacterium]